MRFSRSSRAIRAIPDARHAAVGNARSAPTKFGAKRTAGRASKAEAAREQELRVLERMGAIRDLRTQVPFVVSPEGCKPIRYIADFTYEERGMLFCEDLKGFLTPEFKIKAKLFQWKFPEYVFIISKAKYRKRGGASFIAGFETKEYGS